MLQFLIKFTCLVSMLYLTSVLSATDVLFYNNSESSRYLDTGSDTEFCRGNSNAELDKVRQILGLPNCSAEDVSEVLEFSDSVDLLVLINDQRRMSDTFIERLDSVYGENLVCASSGHTRVYPNYFLLNSEGQAPLKVLVIGKKMIEGYFSEDQSNEPLTNYISSIISRTNQTDSSPDSGDFSPSINSNAVNNIPAGKGLFQTRAMHSLVNNRHKPDKMKHMATNFHTYGLNWFAVSAGVAEKCEGRLYTEYLSFGHPNFQTFVWMLNESSNLDEQVDRMISAAKNIKAKGIIIDLEGQAFRGHAAEARELYAKARSAATNFSQSEEGWPLSVGITVIGFPRLAPYLNEDDLRAADFVMPQIYNRADNLSASNIRSRLDYWNSYDSNKFIPLAGTHHCTPTESEMGCGDEEPKSAEQFENSIVEFRNRNLSSIGWWRYGSVERGNHWERIQEFELN